MEQLLHEITPLVDQYGLWIVFFGMMVEGTTMILITGILCYLGLLHFKEALPVAILGAITGDQLWYFLGKKYAPRVLEWFPSFKKRIEKLSASVQRKGNWLAFSGRFIYSGAILFPLTLGMYGYPHKKFTLFDTLGVTLWALLGISFGYLLGNGAERFFGKIEKVEHLLVMFVIVGLFVSILHRTLLKYRSH